MVVHWDEVESVQRDFGGLRGSWRFLGDAAGSRRVGVRRIEIAAGDVPTPTHMHTDDEEIFFVLDGSGFSWQDGETYAIRPGDCLVHRACGKAHTLQAGEGGLDLLAFGHKPAPGAIYLPNAQVAWLLPTWVEAGGGEHPYAREPELDWPSPSPRPESIVNLDEVDGEYEGRSRRLGSTAGAVLSGLNWLSLPAGEEGAPPHCHTAEEEIFVILDGEGELLLWAPPQPETPTQTEPVETHPIRRGHIISRPPGTRIAHSFRAADQSLTYLAYGTKDPNDICWYPRSNKVYFRGIGLIARLDPLDYFDDEPA
jgi:uncharacterized cupin superfamily protein